MIAKCEKGHWYDTTVHKVCPHCKRSSEKLNMRIEDDVVEDDKTVAFAQAELSLGEELGAIIGNNSSTDNVFSDAVYGGRIGDTFLFGESSEGDDDKTISFGFFGVMETPPVTGWLICMTGAEKGKDYRLHSDKNFVGRSTSMDVVLVDDKKIAREKHCSVIYDPKGNQFYVAVENGNTTYLNQQMITETKELKEGDVITIGDTELVFVPFCKGERVWEED